MSCSKLEKLKEYLESIYDIPFEVKENLNSMGLEFNVKAANDRKELFDICVKFKNKIRLIIEVMPEKYAAFSIEDMGKSDVEKKKIFAEYAEQLIKMKARMNFYINDILYDAEDYNTWPEKWKSYRIRISRSPVCEDENFDEVEVATPWIKIVIGMILSLLNVISCDSPEHYYEGGIQRIECNRYERNPVNRELCLAANGYQCKICGFDFERVYGDIGKNYIHVHHIIPVSTMKTKAIIDPVKDLIPVCPNCHAMLHRKDPPFLPEEIKKLIKDK